MNELTQPTSSVTRHTVRIARGVALAVALTAGPALAARPGETPPAAPAPAAAQADPLVRKVVEAYGGRAALGRVRALRQVGRITATAQGGKTGTLTRLFARPDSLRVDIAYPDGSGEIRIAHAGKGLRQGSDVTGTPPHAAMVLQAARVALPLWLADDPARARRAGRVERDGRRLEALAVDLPGGLELLAEVDPASGRILRTVGIMAGPGGEHLEFVNAYADFRKVSGVLFAFREENFAGGRQTGRTELERVELLDAAPPGVFAGGTRPF